MKRRIELAAFLALLSLAGVRTALGAGILIPDDVKLPPCAVKYLRVDVEIDNQAATTHVTQAFRNNTARDLEATFLMPLPKGASVNEFILYMNGKPVKGEMVEAEKARRVYERIVRQMRDPGLLEYIDGDLIRFRIYPVPANGTQKVELEYTQLLPADDGLARFEFPLRTSRAASRTMEDFTLTVRISSRAPLRTVYSPTHAIAVTRPDDHHATAGFEKARANLDRDFVLYYKAASSDIAATMMTYRPRGEDGYFLMLLSPGVDTGADAVIPRDVIFVIDTSGSMQGEKIEQARSAVKYCLGALSREDRFNVIRFATDVEALAREPLAANPRNIEKAQEFVRRMEAVGGTCIHDALTTALSAKQSKGRPLAIIFVTDGKPTVGETDAGAILTAVKNRKSDGVRIFTFGVGYDVNTRLLDGLARQTRATGTYVKPEEDIEQAVSSLYRKTARPVMTDVAAAFKGVRVYDVYPKRFPDLFAGDQFMAAGRYSGSGDCRVKVTGSVGSDERTLKFVFDMGDSDEKEFIPRIFATRKIAYLLAEIRRHGENAELKDEVIRLAKKFGIATPYTSYLVVEEGQSLVRRVRRGRPVPLRARHETETYFGGIDTDALGEKSDEASVMAAPPAARGGGMPARAAAGAFSMDAVVSGKEAVVASRLLARMQEAPESAAIGYRDVKVACGFTFYRIEGHWVDSRFDEKMTVLQVQFGSDAYFTLWERLPDMRDAFSLGDKLILVVNGRAVVIGDKGKEKLSKADWARLGL